MLSVAMEPDHPCAAVVHGGQTARALTVVIADDDVLLREGLASLLDRSGLTVVGQAADAVEVLSLVGEHRPDLVVVDVRMPPTHTTEGLDAARVIRQQSSRIGILVLSAHVEAEHAVELLANEQAVVTCSRAR